MPTTLAIAVVLAVAALGGERFNEWRDKRDKQARVMAQATEHWGECGAPLLCALWQGDKKQASALLENGASANARSSRGNTALMWAAVKSDSALTQQLLQHDGDPNAHNDSGNTALMTASFSGNIEIMRLLLDAGAEPNAAAKDGHTALMSVAFNGNVAGVQLLLDHGADPAQKGKKGETAMYFAFITRHTEAANLLAARQGLRLNVQTDPNAPL